MRGLLPAQRLLLRFVSENSLKLNITFLYGELTQRVSDQKRKSRWPLQSRALPLLAAGGCVGFGALPRRKGKFPAPVRFLAGREVKTCFMIPPLSEKPSAGVFSFPSGLRFRCFRSRCFGSRRLAGLPVLYFGRERARKSRRGTGGFRYPGAGAV